MKTKVGLALLAAACMAGVLVADDVLLTNGETFEGVIAEHEGDYVRIRLEFGELRVGAATVERIDHSPSALADYLERRRGLLAAGGTASEWLELARWARSRALSHGYREALLEAAAVDPHFAPLAAGMRDLGYVFEPDLERWIPYAEHMRRAGWVRHRGEWMRPEARVAADQRRSVEATLAKTVEILARAELERETRETRQTTRAGPTAPYGFPVAHFGGWLVSAPSATPVRRPGSAPAAEPTPLADDLFRRQPGSLLPVGGVNSGRRIRQPGSLLPVVSGHR